MKVQLLRSAEMGEEMSSTNRGDLPSPEEVFTPKAVVSPELFERRNEPAILGSPGLQDLVVEALRERGAQLRVFGDTGVGKTSLVTFAAREADLKRLVVECMGTYDYAEIIRTAITKIQGVTLRRFVKTASLEAGTEASGGVGFLASIKGTLKLARGDSKEFEIVDQPPLDLLIRLMKETQYDLLVLDNFQNIESTETRTYVAQTMEVLADRSSETGGIKLVVIGIAQDAGSLVGMGGSVRRRTTDVPVPRMPDEEIRSILVNGFRLLGLRWNQGEADSDAYEELAALEFQMVDHLVHFSDGFPFFAHLLGLNVARTARRDGAPHINQSVVARAVKQCTNEVDATYAERLRLAEEVGGKVQPKRRILSLLAGSESHDRKWTSSDVKDLWIEELRGGSDPDGSIRKGLGFIDVALGALASDKGGGVLARDETRRPFEYRFSDPHFRPFLRIRAVEANN